MSASSIFVVLAEMVEHQASGFHHAEAMAVSGMLGAGIGEGGHAELADSVEALEFAGR